MIEPFIVHPRPASSASRLAGAALVLLAFTTDVNAQGTAGAAGQASGSQTPGGGADQPDRPRVDREAMWYPPTAEDWKKPCLIAWQRTYQDALEVSRSTGKPILVCVNMDGEIASEHYAGVRYRMPEIAALYEPYVCVIASVYRHNPRDYDEQGRRIVCPRFGSVTCGEHIAIEPGLYESYFEGQRVAPRHIGLELDGKEMYDVFYAFDTDTIFNSLREGIANRPPPPPIARNDRPLGERVASPDNADRTAVESAFAASDAAARRALLEQAVALGDKAPVEILRLAVRGFDVELGAIARRALARSSDPAAIDLIAEALRVPMPQQDRDALLAALERLGAESPRARTLAIVHRGLSDGASTVDQEAWSRALLDGSKQPPPTYESATMVSRLEQSDKGAAQRRSDAAAQLDLADATLTFALNDKHDRKQLALLLEDARRAAAAAEALGAKGWRVHSTLAIAARHLGAPREALARAEQAMASLPSGAQDQVAIGVLEIFAEGRRRAIFEALREKREWPARWIADADGAYEVIARHPLGSDRHVGDHHDLLAQLGATTQAWRVLDAGLERFPGSWPLHERLRARILAERGVDGLEATYAKLLVEKPQWPDLEWFAGYASLVTAEFYKKAGRGSDALGAYDRAIAHYERNAARNPESRATADHYAAMALAGRARIAFEAEDYERAVAELLTSFERKPEAAASLDGEGFSPVTTAQLVRARAAASGREDLAARLDAAFAKLAAIDPALLEPPAFDRPQAPAGRGNRPRGNR